jgi:hypothetical protein
VKLAFYRPLCRLRFLHARDFARHGRFPNDVDPDVGVDFLRGLARQLLDALSHE